MYKLVFFYGISVMFVLLENSDIFMGLVS